MPIVLAFNCISISVPPCVDVRLQEYVVEDLAGEDLTGNWSPPPLPPEHEKQLRELGLMG